MSDNRNTASEPSDNASENSEVYPGFKTMKEFTQNGLKILMEKIRESNSLPIGQRWDFYTSFPSFKTVMDSEGKRILHLMNMILRHQNIQGSILRRDIEEKFELLVDANDQIFERVGNTLDEILGIRKNPEPVLVEASGKTRAVSGSWNKGSLNKVDSNVPAQFQPQSVRLLTAKNIERPQAKFRDKIDNSNTPWDPRIKEKPNALKPLAILVETSEDGECFSHPYEFELDRFTPPDDQLKVLKPTPVKPMADTPLVMVERQEQIAPLLDDLLKCKTFAVDLEHHSYRSFQGFTCLMQISTGGKDYLIDTLSLRSDLHVLNEAFTNPKILKVFHGAEKDIQWLQGDLSLYVVNMFDTYQAAKALNFAGLSLAFLMKHFCDVNADKHFQLADWRIRPLPDELKMYARADTHYLIYIYECMRNALIQAANGQTNLLLAVYQRSTEVCKRRFQKFILQDDSHMELYRKSKKMFNNRQMYGLQHLFQWRDRVAREEDESTGYVLPNHMLLHMCELLPREIQGILSCCNPIPPLVRQHLVEMHQIILRARDQPLVKPVVEEELRQRPVAETWAKLNLENPLHCPHDMSFQVDFRDDLPTLLKPLENGDVEMSNQSLWIRASLPHSLATNLAQSALENHKPKLELGQSHLPEDGPEQGSDLKPELKDLIAKVNFLSPFECYKKVRPYLDHLDQEKLRKHQEKELQKEATKQVTDVSDDLTFEQRISRMQADIRRMTNDSQNGGPSTAGDSAGRPEEISLSSQAKGVKRKSSQIKGKSLEDQEDEEPQQKQKRTDTKSPKNSKSGPEAKQTVPPSNKTPNRNSSGPPQFEPYDYQQANYSRFQSGDQRRQNQDVRSNFAKKQKKNKNFKDSASKATRGIEGRGDKPSRGGRGRGRGRGRF
ncbi:exosome component 10 [Frankliniella occidentalis]|uniref:Exosome complex component 10 homolog n=1 Tax=Frankliniella occidentalis TaxID=133901 RepID=A0A9C6TT93_FRAOC|nr:exosome component 10 [Frankliniella occidentalis]